jgi:hypothetical protein
VIYFLLNKDLPNSSHLHQTPITLQPNYIRTPEPTIAPVPLPSFRLLLHRKKQTLPKLLLSPLFTQRDTLLHIHLQYESIYLRVDKSSRE